MESAMLNLADHFKVHEPVIYCGVAGGDFLRAGRIIRKTAESAFHDPLIVEFDLAGGVRSSRKVRELEKLSGPAGADPYSFVRCARSMITDRGRADEHYMVFVFTGVDMLLRSRGEPMLAQLIAACRTAESYQGTLVLVGAVRPDQGLPYPLQNIPMIYIAVPAVAEIKHSLLGYLASNQDIPGGDAELDRYARALAGNDSHQIQNIITRALLDRERRSLRYIDLEFLRRERNRLLTGGLNGVLEPLDCVGVDKIVGISAECGKFISLRRDYFLSGAWKDRQLSRGVFISGACTGIGKTFLAHALAGSMGGIALKLSFPRLLDSYVGESERILQNTLAVIESLAAGDSMCCLVADEVEKMFGQASPGDGSDQGSAAVTRRLLSMLLQWLAEHQLPIFTILIGGSLDVPQELIRRGRVDRILFLGPWPADAQRRILAGYLAESGIGFEPAICGEAITDHDCFTPAELRSCAQELALAGLQSENHQVNLFELKKALAGISPMADFIGRENLDRITCEARQLNFLIANQESIEKRSERGSETGDTVIRFRHDG